MPAQPPASEKITARLERRMVDGLGIGRGGLKIGLPDEARATFESIPMQHRVDATLDAMQGCYEPELERDPKLMGFSWTALTLRSQGKSNIQIQTVPGPLKRVMACVRKRLPAPPLVAHTSAETT